MAIRELVPRQMKVLQVGSGLHGWAGIERYVVYLESGLSGRGHEITVSVSPGTRLSKAVSSRTLPISVRHKFDLRAMGEYVRLFRRERFDLVHAHFNPDFLVVAWASKLCRKEPIVMTRHSALPWPRFKAANFSRLYDRIIPVSGASERVLLKSGVPAEKMIVAKAGCPALEPSVPRSETRGLLGMGEGFHVGFFGRLSPEKGLRVLLESAGKLGSDITVHIFGEGPLQAEVEAVVSRLPNVRSHGFRTDIADCMGAVDAVVIPSIWEEAFPYSALEAMSVGKPIVGSRIGGIPELVMHGQTGLLFEPGDSAALCESLSTLAADRVLSADLGLGGQRVQREQFTVERMAERIEAVYKGLANPR